MTAPFRTRRVWVDGRLRPAGGAHLSAFDRGFQLGDGVFETLRVRAGHPTELPEHLRRLRRSASGLSIDLPADLDARVGEGIAALLAAERLAGPDGDAAIRITLTRGSLAERGLLPPGEGVPPTLVVQAWPIVPPPPEQLARGLHLVASAVRRDPENPMTGLKTTSRAEHVHVLLEAHRAGADDALFLTLDGYLSEATSANLFLVRKGELATPTLACAILAGTTREWILRWGRQAGLRTVEGLLTSRDLAEADEAFLSGSIAGILPVTRYEGRLIGDGRPGPWTLRARAAREAFIVGAAGAAPLPGGKAPRRGRRGGGEAAPAGGDPR